jgi:hypothetical protein
MVILRGSTLDRRENDSLVRGVAALARGDLQLDGRCRGLERADAAVARRA